MSNQKPELCEMLCQIRNLKLCEISCQILEIWIVWNIPYQIIETWIVWNIVLDQKRDLCEISCHIRIVICVKYRVKSEKLELCEISSESEAAELCEESSVSNKKPEHCVNFVCFLMLSITAKHWGLQFPGDAL